MSQAESIINILGGVRNTAKLVGAPLTTVQSWRDGGYIPARRQAGVLAAAQAAGIKLKPEDFFAVVSVEPSGSTVAA